jgi:hypothetical protein
MLLFAERRPQNSTIPTKQKETRVETRAGFRQSGSRQFMAREGFSFASRPDEGKK